MEKRTDLIGKKVRIINMKGEPQYTGKTGVVKSVDDIGQLHGTWGGCAIIPEEDTFEEITDEPDSLPCAWCKETFEESDLIDTVEFGKICSTCYQAIKSRGEHITVRT